jgi:hypothetical protein
MEVPVLIAGLTLPEQFWQKEEAVESMGAVEVLGQEVSHPLALVQQNLMAEWAEWAPLVARLKVVVVVVRQQGV